MLENSFMNWLAAMEEMWTNLKGELTMFRAIPDEENVYPALNTYGPSLPSGKPLPKVKVRPITLAISVLRLRYSGKK